MNAPNRQAETEGYMKRKPVLSPTARMVAVPLVNVAGNAAGGVVTYVWFAAVIHSVITGAPAEKLFVKGVWFLGIFVMAAALVIPINRGWWYPVFKDVIKTLGSGSYHELSAENKRRLSSIAGKLIDLPVKLSTTNLAAWILAAGLVAVFPFVLGEFYPWDQESANRICAWMIIVGAPLTILSNFFILESWLRSTIRDLFPAELLVSVPRSFRINVLPKMLFVALLLSVVPIGCLGHIVLRQISRILEGTQSIEHFLTYMPLAVWFLLAVFMFVGARLSVLLARSVSHPLRGLRAAMERVEKGETDVMVPVVSNDEIGVLIAGFNSMVKTRRELDEVKDTFGRYLSQEVADEILKSPGGINLRGELRDITILVADLRGFTPLAESLEPHKVLACLNRFFECMTDIIMRHHGTIDEFTGDGILVFFGTPNPLPGHPRDAVTCALEMQRAMESLNIENRGTGLPELGMGIGINCGELVVGNIGSEKRKKYGAVGSPINMAFRVEAETRAGEILVTPLVLERLNGELEVGPARTAVLKGIDKPTALYPVLGLDVQ